LIGLCALAAFLAISAAHAVDASQTFTVQWQDVDDLKAVYGTIRSKDLVDARVRTGGTIADLKVREGDHVAAGEVLALVVDQKLSLKRQALDAQIAALTSSQQKARSDLDRAEALRTQNIVTQANIDQLKSAYDVAANALKSSMADRDVLDMQMKEGEVQAPASGRLLRVPVTTGSVVMAGESIASIAANEFLVRIELPERHARFIKQGDPIRIGERGLSAGRQIIGTGEITLVHPELLDGRVIADAEATGLGDFYVGERALVWISAGKRKAMVVPKSYIIRRGAYDFVRLSGEGTPVEVVVQLGREISGEDGVDSFEVLSGLEPGDRLVRP
jgi:RND family efflux transporter MFP subunit